MAQEPAGELPELEIEGLGEFVGATEAEEPAGELPELEIEGLGESLGAAEPGQGSGLDFDLGDLELPEAGGSQTEAPELDDLDVAPVADEAPAEDMNEVDTKLDLARAYVDMGDVDDARSILGEVLDEGNEIQKKEAESLIDQL